MGASLVAEALVSARSLNHRAVRALVGMAVMALDQSQDARPARTYFGGHDYLAEVLGLDPTTTSTKRIVKRVVKELVDEGQIEVVESGVAGRRATYHLLLLARQGGRSSHPEGGRSSHPQGGRSSHPEGGRSDHPKEPRRNHGGIQEDEYSSGSVPSPGARPHSPDVEYLSRGLSRLGAAALLSDIDVEGLDARQRTLRILDAALAAQWTLPGDLLEAAQAVRLDDKPTLN